MTETNDLSREQLEAKLAEMNEQMEAREAAPTLSTRDRSPVKPQDHKPASEHAVTFDFEGEKFTVDVRAIRDTRTMFALRKEDMETVLLRTLGEKGTERAIKAIEDEDGYSDSIRLAELVQIMYEKAGAKN